MRSTKTRPYRMRRRAEQVDETRLRITEAAVRLHTTVGPAHTSIAAIAEAAGVTRLTVYRHFADLDTLFEACTAHWTGQNPPPDLTAWPSVPDFEARLRRAFSELYGWFEAHADDLSPIYRDMTAMPASAQREREALNWRMVEALLAGELGAHPAPEMDRRLLRALTRHLVDFRTWRSLAVQAELGNQDIVELAVRLLTAMARQQPRGPHEPPGRSGLDAA